MNLDLFLSNTTTSFPASLSERGGYITFSNSGQRGSVKSFQIGLDSLLTTLRDIRSNIGVFVNLTEYVEQNWRDNGSQYFTDHVAKSFSTVQTKPLFSTLSKLIIWANEEANIVYRDNYMPITNEYLDKAIEKLEELAQSYTPYNDLTIINGNDRHNYSIEELAFKLKSMYDNAENGMQVASIYLFGLKYGESIIRNGYGLRDIIQISTLNASYETEISKSLRIYKAIRNNKYGFSFNNKKSDNRSIDGFKYSQKIYYGAPGTGKSHKIKNLTKNTKHKTLVTFHPDTDYVSFVGCYKPTVLENSEDITYKFVPQAFAKAYVSAWKNNDKPYYLVIEEINRGNCAQIFGDIFQLLDRDENGFSEYVIDVDKDFADYLKKEMASFPTYESKIKELANAAEVEMDGDFDYSKIALPNNLCILATMNTSDQSLFPMDSAFKRRWDWEYVPIDTEKVLDVKIEIADKLYSWSAFLEMVNSRIYEVNKSEDKQLGPFFVVADDRTKIISFEQFRSKVMFYLWFEIYKDEDRNSIFMTNEGTTENEQLKAFTFGDLFKTNHIDIMHKFMLLNKLEFEVLPGEESAEDEQTV